MIWFENLVLRYSSQTWYEEIARTPCINI